MKNKVEQMDKRSRRTNIILSGLKTNNYQEANEKFNDLCIRVLNVKAAVVRIIKLKTKDEFLVELESAVQANNILIHSGKLKDTGIFIQRDFTTEERDQRYHLRQLKKAIRTTDKTITSKFKDTTLFVNEKPFRWSNHGVIAASETDKIFLSNLLAKTNFSCTIFIHNQQRRQQHNNDAVVTGESSH